MTPLQFIGRLLGSLVCAVVFAIAGFFTGLWFPWSNETIKPNREE